MTRWRCVVRRASRPAAPSRAAGAWPGRRHDRPHRRAARRPRGRPHAVGLAAGRPARCWISGRASNCSTATSTRLLPVAGPGYDGALKVQLAGPWTLAASLDLPRGGRGARDAGAVRDLVASLAETVARASGRGSPAGSWRPAGACSSTSRACLRSWPAGSGPRAGSGTLRVPEAAPVRSALSDVIAAAGGPGRRALLRLRRAVALFRCRGRGGGERRPTLGTSTATRSGSSSTAAASSGSASCRRSARAFRRSPVRSPIRFVGCGTSSASMPSSCPLRSRSPRRAASPARRLAGRTRRTG